MIARMTLVLVLSSFMVVLGSGTSSGEPSALPPGRPFDGLAARLDEVEGVVASVADDIDDLKRGVRRLNAAVDALRHEIDRIKSQLNDMQEDVTAIHDTVADLADALTVQVRVDTTACTSAPVQCSSAGAIPAGPATDANDYPIRMFVQVVRNGQGVFGLEQDNFFISSGFVPASGAPAEFCADCDQAFKSSGSLYQIYLRTEEAHTGGTWEAGEYATTLVVTDEDGRRGRTLVTYSIPSASP